MTDYLRIMNVNIKNMKHIYFTHYRFYITQKLYICTINNIPVSYTHLTLPTT